MPRLANTMGTVALGVKFLQVRRANTENKPMIAKSLNETTEADLLALISNGVPEGRTLEYKRELPSNSDSDKKEFLADASSFANTAGGDLIFGIVEAGGLPTQISGVQAADLDLEVRRLDSILGAGLSPRIRYAIKTVTTAGGLRLPIIRVERSWVGPHRVVFQGHDKFYGRNSAGKYPLDVAELRAAFTLSSTATERIRAFRVDRIIALSNNQTPLPFIDSPKIVIHLMPLEAFASNVQYDMRTLNANPTLLAPMGTTRWGHRLNLDGVLAYGTHSPCFTYVQFYRNGVIEVVHGNILAREYQDKLVIPSKSYEQYILEYLPRCFRALEAVGAYAPVVVSLTLTKTKGLYMGISSLTEDVGYPIDQETLILPEIIVESLTTPASQILKPLFDLVWNACGYPESANFDANGNWINRN